MALCPFAAHELIPESGSQPSIRPRMVIAHSTGGPTPNGLEDWWNNPQSKGLESHFLIFDNGHLEQYVDTEVRADANGEANGYAISIETESSTTATERWTDAQARTLVRLIDWCCTVHGIPRVQAKSPTGSGLAWHVQFGAPGPWTPSRGKVCPGPRRIDQYQTEIIPAVQNGVALGEDDLSDDQYNNIMAELRAIRNDTKTTRGVVNELRRTVIPSLAESVELGRKEAGRWYGSVRGWLKPTATRAGVTQDEAERNDPSNPRYGT